MRHRPHHLHHLFIPSHVPCAGKCTSYAAKKVASLRSGEADLATATPFFQFAAARDESEDIADLGREFNSRQVRPPLPIPPVTLPVVNK